MATVAPPPVALKRLEQITTDVCHSVLGNIEAYEHTKTGQWNQTIIEKLLKAVTQEAEKPYKLAINSTIVQHTVPTASTFTSTGTGSAATSESDAKPATPAASTAPSEKKKGPAGRRGMHSATGGYWNEKTDGMWSYKYEGDERGFDVVIMLIWIGI